MKLRDGRRFRGPIRRTSIRLHTAYGALVIPVAEIRKILFHRRGKKGEGRGKKGEGRGRKGEGRGKARDGIRVVTARFPAVGTLDPEPFRISIDCGTLAIPRGLFPWSAFPT